MSANHVSPQANSPSDPLDPFENNAHEPLTSDEIDALLQFFKVLDEWDRKPKTPRNTHPIKQFQKKS